MTRDKARKRGIRARMAKTGKSYTTSRHFVLDEHKSNSSEPPSLPPRIADPGVSDEAILKSTGRTWDEWLAILDAWNGTSHTHTEIARYIASEFGIPGWWAQNVTVGYERARGMRKVHQHLDGYSVSVGRTFNVSVDLLYRAFSDDAERERWLEPELIKARTFTENKVWRCEMSDDKSRVEVRFKVKSPDKTSIAIEHAKLPAEEDVATRRELWKERLEMLKVLIE